MVGDLPFKVAFLALAVAVLLDRWLGEPPLAWHPVVWMGTLLTALTPWVLGPSPVKAFARGSTGWALGAVVSVGAALAVQICAIRWLPWWASGAVIGIALKPLFSWRMLLHESLQVETVLGRDGLEAARKQCARIVSRDTSELQAVELRESALESAAENFNDSVVSVWVWFLVAGLPGAALWRWANTADAMWGKRGQWEYAGKTAAHIDDVLGWIGARVSGLLIVLAGLLQGRRIAWWRWIEEARKTPSPNGGWPMAAIALTCGIRLTKPGVYVLNAEGAAIERTVFLKATGQLTLAYWLSVGAMAGALYGVLR